MKRKSEDMTVSNKALRELAEAVLNYKPLCSCGRKVRCAIAGCDFPPDPAALFQDRASPSTVIGLLDEIERDHAKLEESYVVRDNMIADQAKCRVLESALSTAQAEIVELKTALRPFAQHLAEWEQMFGPADDDKNMSFTASVQDFRAEKCLLSPHQPESGEQS